VRRKAQLETQKANEDKKKANKKAGGAGVPPKAYDPLDRFTGPEAQVAAR